MKFDAVVGNPPYQEENGNTRKPPIYHLFYNAAFDLAPIVSLITPARFLFDAGQTPQEWNQKILNDKYFRVVRYFPDPKDVFDNVQIKGGIAISMRNTDNPCGPILTFTAYKELNNILRRVVSLSEFESIKSIIASQGIYRFTNDFLESHPEITQTSGKGTHTKIISRIVEELPNIFLNSHDTTSEYVRLILKSKKGRISKFIQRAALQPNDFIDTYNVSLPESNGNGAFDPFSTPFITPPQTGVTDTFISIGTFDNETEASNLLKYIKTCFVRAMLGIKKVTQHNPKETWEYVPLQDFTEHSDIDWGKSIAEIDQQLYRKYNLSDDEIAFIEKMIKPME